MNCPKCNNPLREDMYCDTCTMTEHPKITLNIYAHSLPEHKAKEMDWLGKMYNPS